MARTFREELKKSMKLVPENGGRESGGDWPDQLDLQPGPLRTNRAVEANPVARGLKSAAPNQKRQTTKQKTESSVE
jgi:hypothetical protein